jgi:hypothetical protein
MIRIVDKMGSPPTKAIMARSSALSPVLLLDRFLEAGQKVSDRRSLPGKDKA